MGSPAWPCGRGGDSSGIALRRSTLHRRWLQLLLPLWRVAAVTYLAVGAIGRQHGHVFTMAPSATLLRAERRFGCHSLDNGRTPWVHTCRTVHSVFSRPSRARWRLSHFMTRLHIASSPYSFHDCASHAMPDTSPSVVLVDAGARCSASSRYMASVATCSITMARSARTVSSDVCATLPPMGSCSTLDRDILVESPEDQVDAVFACVG